jgi:hypothetical protein
MTYFLGQLVETLPPAAEPVTLEDIKLHLRVSADVDDNAILQMLAAARQTAENYTSLSLISRNYSLFLDAWPSRHTKEWWDGTREGIVQMAQAREVWLPKPPLMSVTAVRVYDASGGVTIYPPSSYFVDFRGIPGSLILKDGVAAPQPGQIANGIEIQFTAGYGATAATVPAPIRQAIRQIVAHMYERRGDDVSAALEKSGAVSLLQPYRFMSLS